MERYTAFSLGFGGLLVLVLMVAVTSVPAQAEVTITETDDYRLGMFVHTAGRVQALDDENAELSTNFQHALGNIGFRLETGDYAEVFFDATMASRVHAEKWWGHEGYVIGRYFPEKSGLTFLNPIMEYVNIKAGHMRIDFGNSVHRRSLNADAQRNPLVGNSIVSPHATEAGIELIHEAERYKLVAGISAGNPTDNFSEFANPAYHGKVEVEVIPGLNVAGSYYSVSHDDGEAGVDTPSVKTNLFSTDRLGEAYGGVTLGSGGQIQPGAGADVSAWQADISYEPTEKVALHGFYGNVQDDQVDNWRSFGSAHPGDSEWDYYSAEGSYKFAPYWEAAARYSVADAQEVGGDSSEDGEIDRVQVGVNTWMTERMMFKLEYVDQDASDFPSEFSGGFDGAISEVSYSF
jgi:hypothetical protein